MITSSSLCIVTPYFVKMDMLPLLAVLTTLISEVGNSSNVSTSAALLESCSNDSEFTYLPLQAPPLATPNLLSDILNIGRPNLVLSFSLMEFLSAPESYVTIGLLSCCWYVAMKVLILNFTCLLSCVELLFCLSVDVLLSFPTLSLWLFCFCSWR